MDSFKKRLALSGLLMLGLPVLGLSSVYAAKPLNLGHQKLSTLQSVISAPAAGTEIIELSRLVSASNTLHVRIQQTYNGFKVWGADAVVHVPNGGTSLKSHGLQSLLAAASNNATMNGTIYPDLNKELSKTRAFVLSSGQADKAMERAISTYTHQLGNKTTISDQKVSRKIGRAHV